ncbi:MAG: hypothetical protein GC185_12340 [Alphaproteobacteria bacterium]|nr:hypothetical protein [Alphaproteobacteria bacterium]
MAKEPKPGEPGGTRWNYDGWEAAYDGEKYVDVTALAKQRAKTHPLPPKNTLKTQFGRKGLKTDTPRNAMGKPEKSASEIVRQVRQELKDRQKPGGFFKR